MSLKRPSRGRVRISLVPMIDVLFILLAYFMVTSVYLHLDMIPVSRADPVGGAAGTSDVGAQATVMVRIGSDGGYRVRGRSVQSTELAEIMREERALDPTVQVFILPSMQADLQALTTVLDTLERAGISGGRVLRLEGET